MKGNIRYNKYSRATNLILTDLKFLKERVREILPIIMVNIKVDKLDSILNSGKKIPIIIASTTHKSMWSLIIEVCLIFATLLSHFKIWFINVTIVELSVLIWLYSIPDFEDIWSWTFLNVRPFKIEGLTPAPVLKIDILLVCQLFEVGCFDYCLLSLY